MTPNNFQRVETPPSLKFIQICCTPSELKQLDRLRHALRCKTRTQVLRTALDRKLRLMAPEEVSLAAGRPPTAPAFVRADGPTTRQSARVTFRLNDTELATVDQMVVELGVVTRTDVVRLAVRELFEERFGATSSA